MTMAAAIERRTAEAPARSKARRVARVDILDNLDAAETIWRAFETAEQFSTPYQRFDFLSAWQRQVGGRDKAAPFILVAYDTERNPLLLLPLVLRRKYGIRTASFMGGKHTTFNMALCDRDFAAQATAADLDVLLSNEPASLISNSFRKRLKSKERKLQALSGYRYQVASTEAEIARLLDWFFQVKPLRMAEQKLPNVFADPGVGDFIRSACQAALPGGGYAIDIHALACDEEIIALFAGVADGHRFSMMFNTYTMSEHSRYSPGLILMRNIIDHYSGRGYRALDLGIGSDDYKRMFCKSCEPIFDSFIPLTPRGKPAAAAISALHRGKRLVKQNQTLLRLAQRLQRTFH